MKNKLNNKGFAVTTVVYAILLLLIILMFTILLLYRNTYRNQKQFSADVQDELNDHLVDQTPPDTNPPECFLTSVKNADDTYTLTISEGDSPDIDLEEGYSFDGINFSSKKTTTVSRDKCGSNSCTYQARTKDASGNMNDVEKYPCKVKVDFDTTAPTCTLTQSGSGTSRTLTIKSTDSDAKGYVINNDPNFSSKANSTDFTSFTVNKEATVNVNTSGTYYGYVIDNSNNISNFSSLCSTVVTIDTTKPTCTLTASGRGSSVTLTISSTDRDILSTGYSFDGTNFTSTTQTTVTSAGTYKAYVKDTSGNISNACNATVDERIATFKHKSTYSSYIDSPSDGEKDSCLVSSGGSCSVEAPEITLNWLGTLSYSSYQKGWGTSSTSTTITYSAGDSITLSDNKTFYTVFKNNGGSLDDGGGSSSGCGECRYSPRNESAEYGECKDGKRSVTKCVKDTSWGNGAVCIYDSNGNPEYYYGEYSTTYEDC